MPRPCWFLPVAAAVLTVAGASRAGAQTTYLTRTGFDAAFTATGGNSLDDVTIPDPPGYLSATPPLAFGGLTTGVLFDPSPNPVLPDRVLRVADFGSGQSWNVGDGGLSRITFTTAVRGFGATFFDAASAGAGDFAFRYYFGATLLGSVVLAGSVPGYEGFFGVDFGTLVTRVDIDASAGDQYEMDDLAVGAGAGAVVPEPATFVLVAAGGLALAGAARRHTRLTAREGSHA